MTVLAELNHPPVPFTQASRAPGTWRSPHSPLSCLAASTRRNMPLMPGWQEDRPPPSVLVGREPPTRSVAPSTKGPPSPFLQKPSPSSVSSTIEVKASYSWQTSMSAGVTPARPQASVPDSQHGEDVAAAHP